MQDLGDTRRFGAPVAAADGREAPVAEPARWRLRLLGGCRLEAPDGSDRTPPGRKTRGLLAVLALLDGASIARERLAGLLWSERAEEQARASLRHALRELRRQLDEPGVLEIGRERVALATERIAVDALELVAATRAPRSAGAILELCRGELLEGLGGLGEAFDDWLAGQRARWRGLALEALERALEAAGEPAEIQALTARILTLEPAHEPAHRAIMLLHAGRGDTAAAIRQFELCRSELARRLDARPSEATLARRARIRAGTIAAVTSGASPPRPSGSGRAPSQTSILVLPFAEQSGNVDRPPSGERLAEEIASALARFRWLFVVAPSTAAGLGRQLVDPVAIGRRLDARYLVAGRLVAEPDGEQRVRVDLIEVETGRLVRSEQERLVPSGSGGETDELVTVLAARIGWELMTQETRRLSREPIERADASRLMLRAVQLAHLLDFDALDRAAELLRRAIALDPDHGAAQAWLGAVLVQRAGYPWREGHAARFAEGERCAAFAVHVDPADALGLAMLGHCRAVRRDFEQAQALSDAAIAANPASATAWARRGLLCCYRGDPKEALACMARYRRLAPFDPLA
ncbi:MAG: BTAD domain-containing putative transcriptional regulator, partial [Geminicoccaceae bacterium]|nr:BTAD domain-containing putative transcriptional regulator [Geminicoccaceae bacterium]